MAKRTILVVEDDPAIRQGLLDALGFEGYETLAAASGQQGLDLGLSATFDLMLLDLVLPEVDGFEILRQVREARATLPVIVLTARGSEGERVKGLRLGADDYVVKPFSIRELLARIEAVLRRSPERPRELTCLPIPGGEVDLARQEVRFTDGQQPRLLSERESELLHYLASNAGRAVSRDEILARVWRISPGVETRTIDMHVARLRDKLRADPTCPDVILTVRGKGYMLRGEAPA